MTLNKKTLLSILVITCIGVTGFFLLTKQPPTAAEDQVAITTAKLDDLPIGTISKATGLAFYTHNEVEAPLEVSQEIYLNDFVRTGHNARLTIAFNDNSSMTLSENAYLTLDKFIYNPNHDEYNKLHVTLLRGGFKFISGLIANKTNPDIVIETEYGSIGLRGTKVWAAPLQGRFRIYVEDGNVDVVDHRGIVSLKHKEGTHCPLINTMTVAANLSSPKSAKLQSSPTDKNETAETLSRGIQAETPPKTDQEGAVNGMKFTPAKIWGDSMITKVKAMTSY